MKLSLLPLLIALSLISCVHKYAVPATSSLEPLIPTSATVCVALPQDGHDDRPRTYDGSGGWTRSAVESALTHHGVRVISGGTVGEIPRAVAAAGAAGADYLVYPQIAHWSDRATEWSGIPDRITLVIRVYNVPTGKVLNRQEISASSRNVAGIAGAAEHSTWEFERDETCA